MLARSLSHSVGRHAFRATARCGASPDSAAVAACSRHPHLTSPAVPPRRFFSGIALFCWPLTAVRYVFALRPVPSRSGSHATPFADPVLRLCGQAAGFGACPRLPPAPPRLLTHPGLAGGRRRAVPLPWGDHEPDGRRSGADLRCLHRGRPARCASLQDASPKCMRPSPWLQAP